MSDKSKIEWTDATWNPIRGCSKVSAGCAHCYAEKVAARFSGAGLAYEGLTTGGKWNGKIAVVEDALLQPLKWTRPRKIFVNSMSDLFHENVSDETIDKVFAVMACCPQHTFQILTKRADRMAKYMLEATKESGRWDRMLSDTNFPWPDATDKQLEDADLLLSQFPALPNVWLGVSVEDQKAADERIPHLLRTPAAVRWLSCEPLLGEVDIRRFLVRERWYICECEKCGYVASTEFFREQRNEDDGDIVCPKCNEVIVGRELGQLGWVVVGGESGAKARPMHPDWARSLRDQCQAAGVPFFFKQWGEWAPLHNHHVMVKSGNYCFTPSGEKIVPERDPRDQFIWPHSEIQNEDCFSAIRVGKKAAGRVLDGRTWDEFPAVEDCAR